MRILSSKTQSGSAGLYALLFLFVLQAFAFNYYYRYTQARASRAHSQSWTWAHVSTAETAKSAFGILEAALERRMWEMPPDSDCMKRTNFGVSGDLGDGTSFSVTAEYNPKLKIITMYSKATAADGSEATFRKSIKVLDTSDFLVASANKNPTLLNSGGTGGQVGALIAKNRKLYFSGPVEFVSRAARGNPASGWATPTPMRLEHELGVIIQGERIYFKKGMYYPARLEGSPTPRPENLPAEITDWVIAHNPVEYGSLIPDSAGGGAFITADADRALEIKNAVQSMDPSGLPARSEIFKNVYPKALFCGTIPLYAPTGTDNGCYMNNPDGWIHYWFSYHQGFGNNYGLTCYSERGDPHDKSCNDSNVWPNGFAHWKQDAGLDNVLLGSESDLNLSFPDVSWDNFDALHEDAEACGVVVTEDSNDGEYEDCDITNGSLISKYTQNPGVNPCDKTYKLNLENMSSKLPSFNVSNYTNPQLKDLLLRRVVYSKVPVELSQTQPQGVWASLASPTARQNASIWVVGERPITLKPYQSDLTSPLDVNPGVLRKVYFNRDVAETRPPVSFVMLTPDPITVISPFHKPMTYAELQNLYPVVAQNKIRLKVNTFTDYTHQEDDGFKYGVRRILIDNVAMISSTALNYDGVIRARGLWSAYNDASGKSGIMAACLLDKAGDATGRDSWSNSFPDSPDAPPVASRFYYHPSWPALGGERLWDSNGYPWVFAQQLINGAPAESQMELTGIRVVLNFRAETPAGRRRLDQPQTYGDGYWYDGTFDMSGHRYSWNANPAFWWNNVTDQECVAGGITVLGTASPADWIQWINKPAGALVHSSPPAEFRGLGALAAQELPVVRN